MEYKPLVSVVMITFNHGLYLADAINGVLMQECDFEFELIISDDCSPDNTANVVESFLNHKNFHRIKYFKHVINIGANDNFIWAVKEAKGKYLALCEGDDYWIDNNKLQKQVDFLESNKNCGLVGGLSKIRLEPSGAYKNILYNGIKIYNKQKIFLKHVLSGNLVATATIVCRNIKNLSEFLENYRDFMILENNVEPRQISQDHLVQMVFAIYFDYVYIFNDTFAVYRRNSGGVTSSNIFKERNRENLVHLTMDYLLKNISFFKFKYYIILGHKLLVETLLNFHVLIFAKMIIVNITTGQLFLYNYNSHTYIINIRSRWRTLIANFQ